MEFVEHQSQNFQCRPLLNHIVLFICNYAPFKLCKIQATVQNLEYYSCLSHFDHKGTKKQNKNLANRQNQI